MLLLFGPGKPAVIERWLPYAVAILGWFHCNRDGAGLACSFTGIFARNENVIIILVELNLLLQDVTL